MSINTSNISLAADVDVKKTKFVSHSVRKPEYKEYAFQAARNEIQKNCLQNKVATFWNEINRHDYAAPPSTLFKPKLIQECVLPSDDDDDDDDDDYDNTSDADGSVSAFTSNNRKSLMSQTWTHTLCLFKKRGLDKLALAARPKLRNKCEMKFPLQYSDEVCRTFVADYGSEQYLSE